MSEQTKIQWCDSTVNFWSGCTKVSAGCANCYAEALSVRFSARHSGDPDSATMYPGTIGKWGKGADRQRHESAFRMSHRLNRKPWIENHTGKAFSDADLFPGFNPQWYHRRRIFSLSLGDWLDPEVPIEWLAEMLDTIRQCDQVEWILCTKRPELWLPQMMKAREASVMGGRPWIQAWLDGNPPANITLLASVENEAMADLRIPQLLAIPAARRGLSLEPLLEPVNLLPWIGNIDRKACGLEDDPLAGHLLQQAMDEGRASAPCHRSLDWLIIGGESGANARPCNVDWIRSLVRQGQAAGVATFVKQLGAVPYTENANMDDWPDETEIIGTPHGACAAGVAQLKDKKGADPAEWPDDLRVQQWPKGMA